MFERRKNHIVPTFPLQKKFLMKGDGGHVFALGYQAG